MLLLLLLYSVNAYNNLIIDNYKLVYYIINKKFNYLPYDIKEEVTQDAFIGFMKSAEKLANRSQISDPSSQISDLRSLKTCQLL